MIFSLIIALSIAGAFFLGGFINDCRWKKLYQEALANKAKVKRIRKPRVKGGANCIGFHDGAVSEFEEE